MTDNDLVMGMPKPLYETLMHGEAQNVAPNYLKTLGIACFKSKPKLDSIQNYTEHGTMFKWKHGKHIFLMIVKPNKDGTYQINTHVKYSESTIKEIAEFYNFKFSYDVQWSQLFPPNEARQAMETLQLQYESDIRKNKARGLT